MEKLIINSTINTPTVELLPDTGEIKISGRSSPENPHIFYEPIYNWFIEYRKKNKVECTKVDLKLDYFNTASAKIILHLLYEIEKLYKLGNDVIVNWHYPEDDETHKEAGEDYQSILTVPFELVSYEQKK